MFPYIKKSLSGINYSIQAAYKTQQILVAKNIDHIQVFLSHTSCMTLYVWRGHKCKFLYQQIYITIQFLIICSYELHSSA